jgi:hypothetical protein
MPSVNNVHQRKLLHEVAEVGALIDSLASAGDRLWPAWCWPAQRLDGPLAVGARGGHGPIRYTVAEYAPGARVVYRNTAPRGLIGRHGFEAVARDSGTTVLRHTLTGTTEGTMRPHGPRSCSTSRRVTSKGRRGDRLSQMTRSQRAGYCSSNSRSSTRSAGASRDDSSQCENKDLASRPEGGSRPDANA